MPKKDDNVVPVPRAPEFAMWGVTVQTCFDDDPRNREPAQVYARELVEFRKLQTNHVRWTTQLLIFIGSLLAFFLVGRAVFNLTGLLMITAVLLIHELGHFIAMYLFGYRNLKMFFIPLLGAAVSGYRCVSVLKEAVVFLMGPIPGILIGCGCGLVYWATDIGFWRELARMFVLLNALNLLPVFPLDGGRFVWALLPHRTKWVQWVLQITIPMGLFAGGFYLDWSFAGFFAGFALGSTLGLRRIHRMVNRYLEARTVDPRSPEDVPEEVALDLIAVASVENSTPKPKRIARAAWELWTCVKAARPNSKEAVLLVSVYLATWLSALLAWWFSSSVMS